ncbi:MAG: two-component regulator propeller domain-containing protein [Acidobacteriota bacterium]
MTRCDPVRAVRLATLAFLMALAAPPPAVALDPARALHQYIHDAWGKKLGLPQQAVYAIAQTRDGYLWLATEEGLVRFDGARMEVFNLVTTKELGSSDVRSLLADPAGGLWIGTSRHLVRYDGVRFEDVTPRLGGAEVGVRALTLANGALWVLSDNGVHRIVGNTVTTFTAKNGLPDARLTAVLPDGADSAWIATMAGLARLQDGKVTVYTTKQGLPHDSIFALLPTGDGGVWIGTMTGLAVYRQGRIAVPTNAAGLRHITVRALARDENDALWIGTVAGVFRLVGDRLESLTSKTGLSDDTVVSLLVDREGSLWLGTMFGGLNRLRNSSIVLMDRLDGLAGENVACVMESRDRSVWIGFVDAGLDRLTQGRIVHYSTKDGLPSKFIRSLAEAPDGAIWVGTTAGLAKLVGNRFTGVGPVAGRPHEPVAAIAIDAGGSVWVGTPSGISRLHGGAWLRYTKKDGASTAPAWAILASRSGDVWIGTDGGGLLKYDGRRFETFDQPRGSTGGQILDIHEDAEGVLWIGTDHGISRYKNGVFTTIDPAHGLFSNTVFRILDDGAGNFWMSSNVGVARVSKKELNAVADGTATQVTSMVLGSDAGAKEAECNGAVQPSGWRTSDGKLWFSTSAGAAVIEPGRLWLNTSVPPVSVEKLETRDRRWDLGEPITLPAGEDEIRVTYGAASFITPDRIQFKYILDGLDSTAWHNAGNRREATFVNLGPGKYVFRVMAANADGVWNKTGASVAFEKRPHYYQTWWFYGLCVWVVGASLIGGFYWRLREHARRERELTSRVEEALAAIKTLHGLLPICAWCKKVRNDSGYWEQIEVYVRNHTEATFSHGICPDCRTKVESDLTA